MKLYADYDFCVQEYSQDITEDEFNKYILKASAYIRRLTLCRSDCFIGEQLKYAACAVVEAYSKFDKENPDGRIITSENNDGFSQSFAVGSRSFERQRDDRAYAAARLWLTGTGLLSRRVRNCDCECRHNSI